MCFFNVTYLRQRDLAWGSSVIVMGSGSKMVGCSLVTELM